MATRRGTLCALERNAQRARQRAKPAAAAGTRVLSGAGAQYRRAVRECASRVRARRPGRVAHRLTEMQLRSDVTDGQKQEHAPEPCVRIGSRAAAMDGHGIDRQIWSGGHGARRELYRNAAGGERIRTAKGEISLGCRATVTAAHPRVTTTRYCGRPAASVSPKRRRWPLKAQPALQQRILRRSAPQLSRPRPAGASWPRRRMLRPRAKLPMSSNGGGRPHRPQGMQL